MNIAVSGSILSGLREKYNIPISIVSAKSGLTEEELLEAEKSSVSLSVTKLKKIAAVYKSHWSIFLLDELPKDAKRKIVDCRRIELRDTPYSSELIFAIEKAMKNIEISTEIDGRSMIEDLLRISSSAKNMEPTALAFAVRKLLEPFMSTFVTLRSETEAYKFWKSLIEETGIYVSESKLDMSEVRGFSLRVSAKAVIHINAHDSSTGKIFTLFHELGHILKNVSAICDIADEKYSSRGLEEIEIYCNAFAAEFLVDKDTLSPLIPKNLSYDDINRIKRKFRVSSFVIIRRFLELGYISKEVFEHWTEKSLEEMRENLRKKEERERNMKFFLPKDYHAKKMINDNSVGFTVDVFEGYYSKRLSYSDISSYLNIKIKNLPTIKEVLYA